MKFNKKLSLNKETISQLNKEEMANVNGGEGVFTWFGNTCKKKDSDCQPTRCGNGNTTLAVSGPCTCVEACPTE